VISASGTEQWYLDGVRIKKADYAAEMSRRGKK